MPWCWRVMKVIERLFVVKIAGLNNLTSERYCLFLTRVCSSSLSVFCEAWHWVGQSWCSDDREVGNTVILFYCSQSPETFSSRPFAHRSVSIQNSQSPLTMSVSERTLSKFSYSHFQNSVNILKQRFLNLGLGPKMGHWPVFIGLPIGRLECITMLTCE